MNLTSHAAPVEVVSDPRPVLPVQVMGDSSKALHVQSVGDVEECGNG